METVEVVIRIPKRTYDRVSERGIIAYGDDAYYIGHAIKNGTVLPKGHGDLIDKENLVKAIEQKAKRLKNLDTINGLCGAVALAYEAETVIEADRETEDGR